MKRFILYFLAILSGDAICQSALPEPKHVRQKYEDSLQRAIKILKGGKTPKVKLIEFCIPETSDESHLFFSFDNKKETGNAFNELEKKIFELAIKGNVRILKKYLTMSQFVDGYFAEGYFDDVDTIIQKQKDLFCKTINDIPQEKTRRLSERKNQVGCH